VPKAAAGVAPLSFVTRTLNLLSSVRFGVTLLVLLVVACMIGMLIMQQNVEGFDKYYAQLTPSQKLLYGSLGFFDIYHAWYFNLLLLILSLNIVLASIDRFPKAWTYISRRKLDASAKWLTGQEQHATLRLPGESASAVADNVAGAFRAVGLKPTVTEKNGRTFVFGERGAWNRLGAYAVHVALLTIFTGGFLTAQFGRNGNMRLTPGQTSSEMSEVAFNLDQPSEMPMALPFEVTCTDIQQKLIERDGPITANNTLDWLTRIKIKDPEYGETEALVHMNRPFDYRGYRFFQASFIAIGMARNVKLHLTPQSGEGVQEVTIPRDGSTMLPDGTKIRFAGFYPDFKFGNGGRPAPAESADYSNPAALLEVTPAGGGQSITAYAFARELPSGIPVGEAKAGYKFRLIDFERAPYAHVLSIQNDPGATIVYVGFALLALTLSAVFFFSHQRVWAAIEGQGKKYDVVIGGNTNRNKLGFEDRFRRITKALGAEPHEAKS